MDNCLLAVDGMAGALLDDIEPGSEVKAVTQPDASLLVTKPPLSNLSQARIESAQPTEHSTRDYIRFALEI